MNEDMPMETRRCDYCGQWEESRYMREQFIPNSAGDEIWVWLCQDCYLSNDRQKEQEDDEQVPF